MKVTVYCINEGTASQYYGLKNKEENTVLRFAPNNWKTVKGALRWAVKNGYEISDAPIAKAIPRNVRERTTENMEVYGMCLNDAFEEAVRTYAKKGTELWNAWYYSDFRAFIPSAYAEEYLNFEKYPLAYQIV